MIDIKVLREEQAQLIGSLNAELETFSKDNKDFTPEQKQEREKKYARFDQIKNQLDEHKKLADMAFSANQNVELPKLPKGAESFNTENANALGIEAPFNKEQFTKGLAQWGRTGDVSGVQKFTITSGTQSGVLLPKDVLQPMVVRRLPNSFRAALAAYGLSPISRTQAASFSVPVSNDTSNVGQSQSESASSGTTADPSFSQSVTLNPTLYSSKQSWWSDTQVSALDFDLVSYLLPVLQKRLDKAQETAWTATAVAYTGQSYQTVAYDDFVYHEVVSMEHALLPAYRYDAVWMLADSLFKIMREVTDNVGRPIFTLDPANSFGYSLNGRPVIVNDYMTATGSGTTSGALISAGAIAMVDVMDTRLVRYVSIPSYPGQVGFELLQNGDCNFDQNGVALIKMGTTAYNPSASLI